MKIPCGMAAGFLVVSVILGGSAAADDRQVPLFRDDDLSATGKRFRAPVRAGRSLLRRRPSRQGRVFREHDRSVVLWQPMMQEEGIQPRQRVCHRGKRRLVTSYHILSNAATVRVMLAGKCMRLRGSCLPTGRMILLYSTQRNRSVSVRLGNSRGVRPEEKAYLMDNLQARGTASPKAR